MRGRCLNPNDPAFERYGGRGIKVCARWDRFENFLADMGERPAGKTLDRENNEDGYTPANCRWSTPREQQNNTRLTRKITIGGATKCLYDWCRQYGLDPGTVRHRIRALGMTEELAVITPKMRTRRSIFEGSIHA